MDIKENFYETLFLSYMFCVYDDDCWIEPIDETFYTRSEKLSYYTSKITAPAKEVLIDTLNRIAKANFFGKGVKVWKV